MMQSDRILVLNPNSSESVTRVLDDSLTPLKRAGGPEICCDTLRDAPPAIESDDDVREAAAKVEDYIAARAEDAGAFVIACFSDPGIAGARAATPRPVFGMAECGYAAAMTRGKRFGVISILPESPPRHHRYIRALGIESRLAGDLPLGLKVLELNDPERVAPRLRDVGQALIDNHAADVLVLGCAGLAAYRAELSEALKVPVIEPVQAAVGFALSALLVENELRPSRAASPPASAPGSSPGPRRV